MEYKWCNSPKKKKKKKTHIYIHTLTQNEYKDVRVFFEVSEPGGFHPNMLYSLKTRHWYRRPNLYYFPLSDTRTDAIYHEGEITVVEFYYLNILLQFIFYLP